MVINSFKFFPVSSGADFLDMLIAVAESPPGALKPTKLEQFAASSQHAERPRDGANTR
jgi:catalase